MLVFKKDEVVITIKSNNPVDLLQNINKALLESIKQADSGAMQSQVCVIAQLLQEITPDHYTFLSYIENGSIPLTK